MSEDLEQYNLKKDQEEATRIKSKIETGEAKDYKEVEILVTEQGETVLTPEQENIKNRMINDLGGETLNEEDVKLNNSAALGVFIDGCRRAVNAKNMLPKEVLSDKNMQEAIKTAFLKLTASYAIPPRESDFKILLDNFPLSKEWGSDPVVLDAVRQRIVRRYSAQTAVRVMEELGIDFSKDIIIQEKIKQRFMDEIIDNNLFVKRSDFTKEEIAFQISDEKFYEYAKEAILSGYRIHRPEGFQLYDAWNVIKNLHIERILTDPEFQTKATSKIRERICDMDYDVGQTKEYIRNFQLPIDFFREAATARMTEQLETTWHNKQHISPKERITQALYVKNQFELPAESIKNAVKKAMITYFLEALGTDYKNEVAISFIAELKNCPEIYETYWQEEESVIRESFKIALIDRLEKLTPVRTDTMKTAFPFLSDIEKDPEVKKASLGYLINSIASRHDNPRCVDQFKEQFYLSSLEIDSAIKEALFMCASQKNKHDLQRIISEFHVSTDICFELFRRGVGEKRYAILPALLEIFPEIGMEYSNFENQQKDIAFNGDKNYLERRKAIEILSALAENGDVAISQNFADIIKNRVKQKEITESKWGLDPAQEAAFYMLLRFDNPEGNDALFDLLGSDNIPTVVKYAILKKLTRKNRNFIDENARNGISEWLYVKRETDLDFKDLRFIKAILNEIPSMELRKKSTRYIGNTMVFFNKQQDFRLNEYWEESFDEIPENIFLQLVNFCLDTELLDKFQKLYSKLKKESSKKENLLYSIVTCLDINPELLELVRKKLKETDFGNNKQDADALNDVLRQVVFIDSIEKIKRYAPPEDEEYYEADEPEKESQQRHPEVIDQEVIGLFSREVGSLAELNELLKELGTKRVQEILPHADITAQKIETILEKWGTLEPVFTYVGRYMGLKEYVAEIVAHIDTAESWKNWRYDLTKKGVTAQIGHLSEEQMEVWKGDYFSEIGDIMVAETGSDKPKQIQHILWEAVLQHRHIFSPEMGQNKNEFISKTLEAVFVEMTKTPDKQTEIIGREIKNILSVTENIDTIINFNNLPRVKQGAESILSSSVEITPSSKIKNTIGFISAFLPAELRKILENNYSRLENQKKMAADELFTSEMRQAVEQRAREIEENYQNSLNSNIWGKYQLDKNNSKNLEQFYQKRQELKSATDLLRLLDLSNKLIATNRIVEKEGKKGGETITSVLERLKKYFKDSPLLQDINNVEFILKENIDFGEKRRLAMIFTDNPQMLWQAGKYPLGNGSCQHYAEGSYANQLMGYVGDPNCKVAYLVDLNKLPQGVRSEIEEKGIEEVKDRIPKQDLLNASLARSIIKMTKDRKEEPVILLEPTYTIVYKGDVSMDRYFNLFVDLMVAEPMKAKIARGGGNDSVIKGRSLSPEGQYEDLDLNGVKFIHKLSKPTKEEMEVMERIQSSR